MTDSNNPRRRKWRTRSELDAIFEAAEARRMLAPKLPHPKTEEEKRAWRFLLRLKRGILEELRRRKG